MSPRAPFERPPLNYQNLQRFEEMIKVPFRQVLETSRVDLLPIPKYSGDAGDTLARAKATGQAVYDERAARLVVPLISGGEALALLVAQGVEPGKLRGQADAFLSALVESVLDNVGLRFVLATDPVTGLANERTLGEELSLALAGLQPLRRRGRSSLGGGETMAAVSLLALAPESMSGLAEDWGRRFADELFRAAAGILTGAVPEAVCVARLHGAFFLLFKGGPDMVRRAGGCIASGLSTLRLTTPGGRPWQGRWSMGAAGVDLRTWQGGDIKEEAAAILLTRALRALDRAAAAGLSQVLFSHEIKNLAGRIKEVLPLDRVVINLGSLHGVQEGEVFEVWEGPEANEGLGEVLAELTVQSPGGEEAVAEITFQVDPTVKIRPGAILRLAHSPGPASGKPPVDRVVELGGRRVPVLEDEPTGLVSGQSFRSLAQVLAQEGEPFAVILLRLEPHHEGGKEGTVPNRDSVLRTLASACRGLFTEAALLGRYAPETLGVLLPGAGADEARQTAQAVLEQASRETGRAFRAGAAAHPNAAAEAGEVLAGAAKALAHAGFLESGSSAVLDAVSLNISGDVFYNQGRISEAVAEYEKALILDPGEVNVLNSLGVCCGHLGQMARAVEYFRRALEAGPGDYMAHYNLGYALMAQGKLAEGGESFSKSLELEPEHADTLFQLGRVAQGEGRLAEAVGFFTRAAQRPDCRKAVYRHWGEVLAAEGRTGEAEEAFNQAVKHNPRDAAALSGLSQLYLSRGANLEIALTLARRARELEPQALRHLRILASVLTESGNLDQAAEALAQGLEEHPQDSFLITQLGQVEAARGDAAAAHDLFTRALALEPNLESAQQGLASLKEGLPGPDSASTQGKLF